jgi:hypothetical protein
MYVNELRAIAKQNELREQAEHSRLVRQARPEANGMLVRSLSAAREQIRKLAALTTEPLRPSTR